MHARFRRLSAPLLILLSLAALAACDPASKESSPRLAGSSRAPVAHSDGPTIAQFLKIQTPDSATLGTNGRVFFRDWPDGVWQLYRATPKAVSKTSGPPSFRPEDCNVEKLTSFQDGLSGFSMSPDGRRIVLMHATGGNENTQLTLLDPDAAPGQGKTPILANPKAQASVQAWLDDSSAVFYSANDESPADFYLYRWDFAASGGQGAPTRILAREGSWSLADANTDGSVALVTKFNSASDSACSVLSTTSGDLRDVTLREEGSTANCNFVGFLPGFRSVMMTSDYRDGVARLYVYDLTTGEVREPLPDLRRFDIDGASMNTDRSLLALATNEDGYGTLHVYSLPDFAPLHSPEMERGVASPGQFTGRTLVWTNNNARNPGQAFSTTWPAPGAQLASPLTTQLTFTRRAGIDLDAFPLAELVKYKSFDGLEIPAFVWLPPGYRPGRPIPFVVNYHGGPEGQHRPLFSATIQYLLSRGYGVLQPNVRGSTGYGREFHMKDDYKKRWDSVRDGVEAARFLVREGYARPGKIAAYGGSYGGFMSVATIVEDQESVDAGRAAARVFGASIDVVGIVNMKTFLEQTSGYRRKLREAEYGPLTDPEFLESVSPIRRVDRIHIPMLIAHGLNDPRVPVGEAMQLAVELQKRGYDPELFFAPDEGHGFAKLENRTIFSERLAKFLDRTIGAP